MTKESSLYKARRGDKRQLRQTKTNNWCLVGKISVFQPNLPEFLGKNAWVFLEMSKKSLHAYSCEKIRKKLQVWPILIFPQQQALQRLPSPACHSLQEARLALQAQRPPPRPRPPQHRPGQGRQGREQPDPERRQRQQCQQQHNVRRIKCCVYFRLLTQKPSGQRTRSPKASRVIFGKQLQRVPVNLRFRFRG